MNRSRPDQPALSTPPPGLLSSELLEAIRQFDTCTIANVIEQLGVRLRNQGYSRPGLACLTGGSPRLLGFAATCSVRSADPPLAGNLYEDRTDWWSAIERLPLPRLAVIQDLESGNESASVVGEVHAAILQAFGCAGLLTNGSVRDIPGLCKLQFPVFARSAAVSHAYTHIVDFGNPVEIFGLRVQPGDLLYADCHGVISIPRESAAGLPAAAAKIRAHEQRIIDLCQSPGFSRERLLQAIQGD